MSEPIRGDRGASTMAPNSEPVNRPADPAATSVGDLVGQIADDLSTLLHQEVALAKAEAKEEAKKAGKAAGLFGGAGLGGWMFAIFATVAAMTALDIAIPLWAAALIVAAIWAVVAGVLAMRGRDQMRQMRGLPETTNSLKEDAQWARHPTT